MGRGGGDGRGGRNIRLVEKSYGGGNGPLGKDSDRCYSDDGDDDPRGRKQDDGYADRKGASKRPLGRSYSNASVLSDMSDVSTFSDVSDLSNVSGFEADFGEGKVAFHSDGRPYTQEELAEKLRKIEKKTRKGKKKKKKKKKK